MDLEVGDQELREILQIKLLIGFFADHGPRFKSICGYLFLTF
jgi:hypothetical protein